MALIGISGKIGAGKDTVGKIIQYLTAIANNKSSKTIEVKKDINLWLDDKYKNSINDITSWEIKKFAYKIKQICSILTGIPIEDFEKPEVKDRLLGKEWERWDYQLPTGAWEVSDYLHAPTKEEAVQRIQDEVGKDDTYYTGCVEKTLTTVRWLLQTVGTEAMRDEIHQDVWTNALFADYKYDEWTNRGDQSEPIFPNWIITDVRFPNEIKAIKDKGGLTIRVNRGKAPGVEHLSETALDNAKFDHIIENDGNLFELVDKVREILIKEKIL